MARTEDLLCKPATWAEVQTAVNATVTATHAATPRMCHFITGFSISASDIPASAVTIQILNGAIVLDQYEMPSALFAPVIHNFIRPYQCSENTAATITMGALGTGVRGTLVLKGFTATP
jgi:hypothetical protein